MTELVYRPRARWTDPETAVRRSRPFMTSVAGSYSRKPMALSDTEQILLRETRELGARQAVIEVIAPERAFRLDGLMRADARIDHPGIVVSIDSRHGPLRYATDTMDRWQDNLRAVALALEALRKVDRYGVTKRGEQYTGWKALPSGIAMPTAAAVQMTVEEAARVLARAANLLSEAAEQTVLDPVTRAIVWRDAVKRHHPDRGGDRATWDRLEQAKHVLDQHGASRG